MYDYDIVCIGSGPAGQRAAVQAAKVGKRAAVVEQRNSAGGVCIETGTIPSKTFREAVRSFVREAKLGNDRLTRQRPTMGELASRVSSVVNRELEIVRDQLEQVQLEGGHDRPLAEVIAPGRRGRAHPHPLNRGGVRAELPQSQGADAAPLCGEQAERERQSGDPRASRHGRHGARRVPRLTPLATFGPRSAMKRLPGIGRTGRG